HLLDRLDEAAYATSRARQPHDRVTDELPGPVVRRAASSPDTLDRDPYVCEPVVVPDNVGFTGAPAERDRRRVAEQQPRCGPPAKPPIFGDALLDRERGRIRNASESVPETPSQVPIRP